MDPHQKFVRAHPIHVVNFEDVISKLYIKSVPWRRCVHDQTFEQAVADVAYQGLLPVTTNGLDTRYEHWTAE